MTIMDEDNRTGYGSRKHYVLFILYQTIGLANSIVLTQTAVERGPAGHALSYILVYIFVAVPILNMELIIGQFTGRDCLDMWKARPCVSHMGYFQLSWLIIVLIYYHAIVSFNMHYLLLSFENPIPYTICGNWSTSDCDILRYNYSINLRCVMRSRDTPVEDYCKTLSETFPESQFWKNYVLGTLRPGEFHVSWRVFLASFLVCVILFFNCFKRFQSVKLFLAVFTIYPFVAYFVLMTGSMMQRGIVTKYEEALDHGFAMFADKVQVTNIILQVTFSTGAGSGLISTLASATVFRSPCYANSVLVVLVSAVFTTLAVFASVMMFCPYSFDLGIKPSSIMVLPIAFTYEKVPHILSVYNHRTFWLVLVYSSEVILGMSAEIVQLFTLNEIFLKRFPRLAKYPSLMCLTVVCLLLIITTPAIGYPLNRYLFTCQQATSIMALTSYFTFLECIVFVVWYGLERFSEDVHFMQGVQPNNFMKIGWISSTVIMGYVALKEIYLILSKSEATTVEIIVNNLVAATATLSGLIVIGKLIYAAYKTRFMESLRLDLTWGPQSELLQRSRAMFTAQAMTKEYMYRQYHLQAGIVARQKRSNIRRTTKIVDVPRATTAGQLLVKSLY